MSRVINLALFVALSLTGTLVLFEQVVRPTVVQTVLDNFAVAIEAMKMAVQ